MPRHQLFYGLGSIYAIAFGIVGIGLKAPHEGVNTDSYSTSPRVMLGWIQYVIIAPFRLILLSLFWSFANSNCSVDVALGSYGVMLAVMEMGGLLGLTVAKHLVASSCFLMAALLLVAMQGCIAMYVKMYGVDERNRSPNEVCFHFLDGCNHYVKGIFVVGSIYFILQMLIDEEFKLALDDYAWWTARCVSAVNGTMVENDCEHFSGFFQNIVVEEVQGRVTSLLDDCVGIPSFVMATSYILRRWGARRSLTFFSFLCMAGLSAPWLAVPFPTSFWNSFIIIAVQKASVYGLFRPLMEILYLSTSDGIRYKASVWIVTIGPVVSGILAILVQNSFLVTLLLFGPVGVCFVLISRMMGRRFEQYIENGYIVGADPSFEESAMTDDNNDEDEGIEPSQGGNRNAETQALTIIV